jgi:hypothetical protein
VPEIEPTAGPSYHEDTDRDGPLILLLHEQAPVGIGSARCAAPASLRRQQRARGDRVRGDFPATQRRLGHGQRTPYPPANSLLRP